MTNRASGSRKQMLPAACRWETPLLGLKLLQPQPKCKSAKEFWRFAFGQVLHVLQALNDRSNFFLFADVREKLVFVKLSAP